MTTIDIPVFPLPTVLFPGGRLPLRIFEQRYIDMVRECSARNLCFGVCLLDPTRDNGGRATHASVGTTAEICDFSTLDDGLLGIVASGRERFVIHNTRTRDNGLLMAEAKTLGVPERVEIPERFSVLSLIASRLMEKVGSNYPDFMPGRLQEAEWVGYRLSELLPLENQDKQALLQFNDPLERLQRLLDHLS